jgi:monoamine oxidase
MQDSHSYKYVIIGGGISAMQASVILAQHGHSFVVLEASERIGGRICSLALGEATKDCPEANF